MKKNKSIALSILLIFVLIAGAFLFEKVYTKYGQTSAKIIKITDKDKVVALISADILKKLMQQNIGKDEEDVPLGPSLLSTINAAGVSKFTELEVKGKGENDSILLNKKDINNDFELALSSNGTVNLKKKGVKSNPLVKEITEISIKN
jgi:hypothetical protein